jgi:F plasmid transfer operon protein TraF
MRGFITFLLALACPLTASAQQVTESTGSRALGMAGAFVGVADDATAVYWNPAGLVTGPPAGMTAEWADFRSGDQDGPVAAGSSRRKSTFVSLGTWPIGLSYGRFEQADVVAATSGPLRVEGLATMQLGATILQSVTQGLTIGSTFKYVRGRPISTGVQGLSSSDALDSAIDSDGDSSGAFDLDLGVLANMGPVRLGLTVRNMLEPSFEEGTPLEVSLHRQARLGLAILPTDGLTLAIDADLDTVDLRDGPRRMLAVGGEDRIGSRWAVRGGVRWNSEGARRPVTAVGASFALRRGFWLDAHYTRGGLDADRGFGVAMRAGF